ncbi:MAG TPA: hypothetical protein ENO21_00225 [Firmicutes bacterium]|nr:hypothetical protein [Bacillota bacterium]
MEYTYNPEHAAAIFVDGITTAVVRGFTPDISWSDYCSRLRERRPALSFTHLEQPYDWREILIGRAPSYDELVKSMAREGTGGMDPGVEFAVVFGFSLGGLTALRIAHAVSAFQLANLKYLALVTLGAPFAGTGRLLDPLFRHVHIDYIQSMLDEDANRGLFEELLERTGDIECRILLGEIERDEMVSTGSALNPAHWLSVRPARANLRWGTFRIPTSKLIRAHDGLLHDRLGVAYIDGLLDGLLPETA